MSVIVRCPIQPSVARADGLIAGVIQVPRGCTLLHVGSEPPRGEICLWVTLPVAPTKDTPADRIDVIIAKAGDNVPAGYTYRGAVWSAPILFVYQKDEEPRSALILPVRGIG